jgi:hypothetical protein
MSAAWRGTGAAVPSRVCVAPTPGVGKSTGGLGRPLACEGVVSVDGLLASALALVRR